MIDVTRDTIFLIYALMQDDININMSVVILSTMKKARYYHRRRHGFDGLLTKFFRRHEIEEEALDYRPLVDTRLIDMTRTKGLDVTHGPVHTLSECHVWDDKITVCMYGLQILQLRVGGRPSTREDIRALELDYLLSHQA